MARAHPRPQDRNLAESASASRIFLEKLHSNNLLKMLSHSDALCAWLQATITLSSPERDTQAPYTPKNTQLKYHAESHQRLSSPHATNNK